MGNDCGALAEPFHKGINRMRHDIIDNGHADCHVFTVRRVSVGITWLPKRTDWSVLKWWKRYETNYSTTSLKAVTCWIKRFGFGYAIDVNFERLKPYLKK